MKPIQKKISDRNELLDADDFARSDGILLKAHPNKHSISKSSQMDVLNNWEKSFTGINKNGRPVDIGKFGSDRAKYYILKELFADYCIKMGQ